MSHAQPTISAWARFGYRGRALSMVGVVWILISFRVLLTPDSDPAQLLLLEHLPVELRFVIWLGAGVCALVTAWWPVGSDRFGFMALVAPAAIRAGSYAWNALLGALTGNDVGHRGDWIDAVAWVVIVAFILLLSAWPEPEPHNRLGAAG